MAEAHFPECKLIDATGYMDFTWQMYFRQEQVAVAGAGNVTGPAVAIGGHVAIFADPSGALLQDGGGPLGSAAFTAATAYDAAGAAVSAQAAAIAASQPRDSDLTAISALATVPFGRSFLTMIALQPNTPALAAHACSIYATTGAPNNADGADGDFCFRDDGAAGSFIYHKAAGVWTGIV
jgi:hypothetical protein